MEFLANLLANTSVAVAETGSNACVIWHIDEPECPESLIK